MQKVNRHFKNFFDCLKKSQNSFGIVDIDDKKAEIKGYDFGHFKVDISKNLKIRFVAIDKCLFSSTDSKRADCAIYSNDILCLIELKECKPKNIKANRKKAKSQLIATINYIKDNDLLVHSNIEAYICICHYEDRERVLNIPNATQNTDKAEFYEEFGIELFFECKKEF